MTFDDCLNQFSERKLDALLQETERKSLQNRISAFYPDEGPLRRELYPKHMAFFAAGREYQERAMVAANRCITPWTAIEMPGATRLVSELIGELHFDVRSWDGATLCTKPASGVFLKSYRASVSCSSGQWAIV